MSPQSVPDFQVGEVTLLLRQCSTGDSEVKARLVELMYPELKRIAEGRMRHERKDHTLQPTALVNEFFLELARQQDLSWRTRAHFLAVASRAMRRYLIDHARAHNAQKRPDSHLRVQLDTLNLPALDGAFDALELDEVLERLALEDPRMAHIVEMRCFGGLTHGEIAQTIGVDERTVKRDWQVARAWLIGQLRKGKKE
jgi:RNA polymerase sigma-70 factor (ECF subfamily)